MASNKNHRQLLSMTLGELLEHAKQHESGTRPAVKAEEHPPMPPRKTKVAAVVGKTVTVGGRKFIRLSEPGYNFQFVRQWMPWNVSHLGKVWKWEKDTKTRLVPMEDAELLMKGLRECYAGTEFALDGKIVLP